jgi:hypothetical protein
MAGCRLIKCKKIDQILTGIVGYPVEEIETWSGFCNIMNHGKGLAYYVSPFLIANWDKLDMQTKICITIALEHIDQIVDLPDR